MTNINRKGEKMTTLKPKKHDSQIDFFIADEVDLFSFRDEITSMELPFFALKAGDTNDRYFENGNTKLSVKSTSAGIATIFDKDIWIYAISKLQQAINNGEKVDREIYFTPYDFLVTTNRSTSGQAYKDLGKTLDRLRGTVIKHSSISKDGDTIKVETFGLIQDYLILENKKGNLEVGMIKLILPEWLFKKLENKEILKINIDYFRIRKAIDRRIYEIARKHCGNQYECSISLDKLHSKTGSSATKQKFKFNIKQLAKENKLPDYQVILDPDRDVVVFKNRNPIKQKAEKIENQKRGKKEVGRIKAMLGKL